MKKILAMVLAFFATQVFAQSYPSPIYNNLSVNGNASFANAIPLTSGGTGANTASAALANLGGFPISGGTLTGPLTVPSLSVTGTPISVTSGGTNCSAASSTCIDNISGFSGTGFLERTGSGAYTFIADPLPVNHGGTGATTLTGALNALGAASNGTVYDVVIGYGGDPTGVADATSAWQNATNACQSGGGGIIWGRAGNYKIAGTITNSGANVCKYQGVGPGNATGGTSGTRLVSSSATADILDISSTGGAYVDSIGFDSSVTRTAGNFLSTPTGGTNNNLIRNVVFSNYYSGINLTWNNGTVDHALFYKPVATTGIGVTVSGNAGCDVLHDVQMFPPGSAVQPQYGILVQNSGCLQISDSDIIQQGTDLALIAATGQTIGATYVSNSFFDTAKNGIVMSTSGTGSIVRAIFSNSWASSHSQTGVSITKGGTGTVSGIQFVNHIGIGNTLDGITINGGSGTATDIGVADSLLAGNGGNGITLQNNSATVTLLGNRTGAYGGVAGNTGCGITVGTGVSAYNLIGNQTAGNTGGAICDASSAGMVLTPTSGGGVTVLGSPLTVPVGSLLTSSPTAGDATNKIPTTFFVANALNNISILKHTQQEVDASYTYSAPATGSIVTIASNSETAIIDPSATLAALTITLPACTSAYDGSLVRFLSTKAITALTVNATSGSVLNGPTSNGGSGGAEFICRGSNTSWYRLY